MEIIGRDRENFPTLPLDMDMDAALAIYCERRWPLGRRKAVEREWGLNPDEARSVIEGKASKRTLGKVWKHPKGGWRVALPIMGAVIGVGVHEHFREQMREAARAQQRAEEHERLASAAYRRLSTFGADGVGEDRPSASDDRGDRRSA